MAVTSGYKIRRSSQLRYQGISANFYPINWKCLVLPPLARMQRSPPTRTPRSIPRTAQPTLMQLQCHVYFHCCSGDRSGGQNTGTTTPCLASSLPSACREAASNLPKPSNRPALTMRLRVERSASRHPEVAVEQDLWCVYRDSRKRGGANAGAHGHFGKSRHSRNTTMKRYIAKQQSWIDKPSPQEPGSVLGGGFWIRQIGRG
jgi:hypothetical protein